MDPIDTIPFICLRSILILSTHLRLGQPSGLFPSGFPINILYAFLFSPFVLHALPISSSLFVFNVGKFLFIPTGPHCSYQHTKIRNEISLPLSLPKNVFNIDEAQYKYIKYEEESVNRSKMEVKQL
jgi:hypothetical protein